VVGLGAGLSARLRSQQVGRCQRHHIIIRGQPCGIRPEVKLSIEFSAMLQGIAERTSALSGNFRKPAKLFPPSRGKLPNSSGPLDDLV
jgi:hypothetical protein